MSLKHKSHALVLANGFFLVAALAGGEARGQQIKGRVMLLVDTSGSMTWHFNDNNTTGGDGDFNSRFSDILQINKNYYPGTIVNGKPDGMNSRLYAAKNAVTAVINATGDLDFGLMRYAPAPIANGSCQNNVNCCNFATPECVKSAYYTADNAGKLTWAGDCGPVSGGLATDGGQILVTPAAGSWFPVSTWVDNTEDFTDNGQGMPKNGELRANGSTPLAGSARTALNKWYKPILDYSRANPGCSPTNALCDPQIDCRPYVLVMMTDGADTCDTDATNAPPAAVKALHDANLTNPVLTYVVGLAFVQNDPAIAVLNSMAVNGGTKSARFANDQAAIEAALGDIVASSIKIEVCNNKDDNCNQVVDEGFDKGAACSVGIGACARTGIKKCDPNDNTQTACCVNDGLAACTPLAPGQPGALVCDNKSDNNCNGIIDSAEPGCAGKGATPEVCDGIDSDFSGVIDDHLTDVGLRCGLLLGECRPGTTQCQNSKGQDVTQMGVVPDVGDHLVCVGGVSPKPEVCNGLDDDCDGVIDGMTRTCFDGPMGALGVGPCQSGTQRCTAVPGSGVEAWGVCVGEIVPQKEICNGIDDDCNGKIDDVMGAGTACCPSGKCGTGICTAGTLQCAGGTLQCVGGQGPQGEVCNGLDDDCNSLVDDLPALGKPCQPMGGCGGQLACDPMQGKVYCKPSGIASKEICNGIDDDCDGIVDNPQLVAMNDDRIGQPCGNPMNLPAPCMAGKTVCKNGAVVCDGAVGAMNEACNCKDDNCNGIVDEDAPCPMGYECRPATANSDCGCYRKCAAVGELGLQCDGGYFCDSDQFCKPERPCQPACQPNEICNHESGKCEDPCATIKCDPGYVCERGRCIGNSCVENKEQCERCQQCDGANRKCVQDKCCDVNCANGLYCDPTDGMCHTPCAGVRCATNQFCRDGQCVPNPCVRDQVTCSEGSTCDPYTGDCVPDSCPRKSCIAPLVCVQSQCVWDWCPLVKCPPGTRCVTDRLGHGHGCVDLVAEADKDRIVGAGGGGFALGCNAGGGRGAPSSSGGGLLLLGLAAVVLRVRRARGVRA